jgi:hypothetical protein
MGTFPKGIEQKTEARKQKESNITRGHLLHPIPESALISVLHVNNPVIGKSATLKPLRIRYNQE